MISRRERKGWLITLRRFSGLGVFLFAFVLFVGVARTQALALAVGDDDLCSAMSVAFGRAPTVPTDSTDLADRHHACCDLGLCLDASVLPPSVPPLAAARRVVRSRQRHAPSLPSRRSDHRRANRPRDPPAF